MTMGANLFVLDHDSNPCVATFFERINQTVSVNPLCWIEASNVDEALEFLLTKGVEIVRGIEPFANARSFYFKDIDGNVFVCGRNE